jgi:2,3-bisphosphoglycerate-dependent phosphoglycerate mutase
MQLYFIRHGQSTNNALWVATGADAGRSHDPELTEVGRRQAELLAEHLGASQPTVVTDHRDSQNRAGYGLTHLYCSLMLRAVQTGLVLANRLALPLHAWIDWHEEGGLYLDDEAGERVGLPGYGRAAFAEKYPALVLPESVGDDGWWNRPFEAGPDRPARARRVLAELLQRHGQTEDRVAVISHGGFYNHFLAAIYGATERLKVGHLMNNCALSRFQFEPERVVIVYQNRASYLPTELVTF